MAQFIRNLADLTSSDAADSGPKAQSLARLMRLNLPVPAGFVVLATAYDAFLDYHDLRSDYDRMIELLREGSPDAIKRAEEFTERIAVARLPEPIEHELEQASDALAPSHVAVRSSATVEDSPTAAWAGQFQTFLNTPSAEVPDAVRCAWSSLFLPRAIAYARHRELPVEAPRIAVILQETVDAVVSGVILTADRVTQRADRLVLEAAFGLGEALVQGVVTPDSYWIDKTSGSVIEHRTVDNELRQLRLDPTGGIQSEELDAVAAAAPKLTDDEVSEVVRMALLAEADWACPLDLEWSKDANGRLLLLQARPITTFSPAGPAVRPPASPPRMAKSIVRGWSLIFCEIWHRSYTEAFYEQYDWRLSEVLYEWRAGAVTVYRAPAEFETGWNELITRSLDADPLWLHKHADELLKMVTSATAWLNEVNRRPLSDYDSEELVRILDEFVERNVTLGPRYVLMLWFPRQMESHPRREEYSEAIERAVSARIASHRLGGAADEFARRIAAEALRRHRAPAELARAIPLAALRGALTGERLNLASLAAYHRLFLVSSEGVLHEDAATYCSRRGIPLTPADDPMADEPNIARGIAAWPGKARGMARIVRGPDDFASFTEGDVLVTSMTTPDFEVIMSDAAGIVTDEGGTTSHAAILAAELRKPTVIGTRIATRLCSSGDIVEVNADDGFMQRLQEAEEATVAVPATAPEEDPGPYVLIVEDDPETLGLLVTEFYEQAASTPLRIAAEDNERRAVRSFRNLRKDGVEVSAIVVDLKLNGDPRGGLRVVEKLQKAGCASDQMYVFSTMATAASMVDPPTRASVFKRLEELGLSKTIGNVFGKVHPDQERVRELLDDDRGELATIGELVTTVLARVGVLAPSG